MGVFSYPYVSCFELVDNLAALTEEASPLRLAQIGFGQELTTTRANPFGVHQPVLLQNIGAGVPVTVTRLSDGVTAQTTLERVLPGTATASQSTIARATVANTDGLWRPGSAVKARVTVDRQSAALVVPITALQTAEDQDVVYVQQGETYHTRPVKLGRRDAERAEVLEGLKAGEQVVVAQSFLIKADIEKSTVEEE